MFRVAETELNFQVMYADTPDRPQAAKENLATINHDGYSKRVQDFLSRKQEWVLLFRKQVMTRGHNTNNFAETSIRILKDIVLCRTKAFNAVALADFVAFVWEGYFQQRILRHVNNRSSSHQLLYVKLLQRMPKEAASQINQSAHL